jgi:head-tail adaptor
MGAAGTKDRQVEILARQVTKDPDLKSDVETWVPVDTVWAEYRESATAGESASSEGMSTYARPSWMVMWWRADVTNEMRLRLVDTGQVLQIRGLAMLGRRRELGITCVEWRHQQAA